MTGVIPMVAASALRRRQGLFVEDDPVTILYGNELKRWLTDGSPGKLMLYYAHWCGHCQAYSPVYKAFAAGITGVYYGLDCCWCQLSCDSLSAAHCSLSMAMHGKHDNVLSDFVAENVMFLRPNEGFKIRCFVR